jgi:hypothetical protein
VLCAPSAPVKCSAADKMLCSVWKCFAILLAVLLAWLCSSSSHARSQLSPGGSPTLPTTMCTSHSHTHTPTLSPTSMSHSPTTTTRSHYVGVVEFDEFVKLVVEEPRLHVRVVVSRSPRLELFVLHSSLRRSIPVCMCGGSASVGQHNWPS